MYILKIEAFGRTHTFRFPADRIVEVALAWQHNATSMDVQEW